MSVKVLSMIKDPERRLKELMRFLKCDFLTDPTLRAVFTDDEIECLKSKGLTKVEVWILNRRDKL